MKPRDLFWIATLAFTVVGALLRLKGIHNPIFDHPGWRQGDTAAIARNFALLQYNPLFPQTDYNGPPPNYVELELQIVPFLAATLGHSVLGVPYVVAMVAAALANYDRSLERAFERRGHHSYRCRTVPALQFL